MSARPARPATVAARRANVDRDDGALIRQCHAKRRAEIRRRGLRAGAVLDESHATYQWVFEIEFWARKEGVGIVRQWTCSHCSDRDICDWKTNGCDRQVNVTRFFAGRKLPIYRGQPR